MRHRVCCSLAAALLVAPALAQSAATKPSIQFEDEDLSARQKDLLARYATTVSRWAMVQRVIHAVAAQNERQLSRERIAEIDAAWQRGESPGGLPTELMSNECAQALQTLLTANPGYADAFVADQRGALVCMTQRTSDYDQSDEEIWSRAFAEGSGAMFVSRQRHDESVGAEVMQIAVPVRSAGRTIGVLVASRLAGG